jgi:hypothetical protein
MAKFPGKLMLDVDDIAAATQYSKGHIYNLVSAKKLPFKLAKDLGDKILVSVVEMSDYLDSKLLSKSEASDSEEVTSESPKRKVGRPRGSTKASLQVRCFQAELRTAIYQYETKGILAELRAESEKITLMADEKYSCAERFENAKNKMLHNVGRAEAMFELVEVDFEALRP